MMGHVMRTKLTSADTNGQFAVIHAVVEPMSGPPLHMHAAEDEWFYVLKGEMWVRIGDEYHKAGPGGSVFGPRGIPHTWQNFGPEPVELLAVITPGGFEQFFSDAMMAGGNPESIPALAERYGNRLMGPPMLQKPEETR
jgi:mannose-6-phosphate isomerase-like protein (cupin superfamily)